MLPSTLHAFLFAVLILSLPGVARTASLLSLPDGMRAVGLHFETDQPTPLPDAAPALDALAAFLRDPRRSTRRYEISTQFSYPAECNMHPSQRMQALHRERAWTIRTALIERGIDPARLTTRLYVFRLAVQEVHTGRPGQDQRIEFHEIGFDDQPLRWRPRSSAGVLAL